MPPDKPAKPETPKERPLPGLETPIPEQSMPKVEELTKLKDEFNNLESGIIDTITKKQSNPKLDEIINGVETKISADQVLAVMIQELNWARTDSSLPAAKKTFFKNFAGTQGEYAASLTAIKRDLASYEKAVTGTTKRAGYETLFSTISKQENLKKGVLGSAESVVNKPYSEELERRMTMALKDPENFIDKKSYNRFKREQEIGKEEGRMEVFAGMDNEKIKDGLDKTIVQLNQFEDLIYQYETDRTEVANRPAAERMFRADNVLLALKNAAAEASKKDPDIYKKIAPFLDDTMKLIDAAAKDINNMGKDEGERKKERLLKLDQDIASQFDHITGLKMEDLKAIPFSDATAAYEEGKRAEELGEEKNFNDKIDALKKDPANGCVRYFLEHGNMLSLEVYQDTNGLPRRESIKSVEITLAYRKLYQLFKNNREYAEKYCSGQDKYEQYFQTLNDNLRDSDEEITDMAYPYFMYASRGKIYISSEAYVRKEDGAVQDTTFVEISTMDGVIEVDTSSGMIFYVTDNSRSIEKHPIIPVKNHADARALISQWGEKKDSIFTQITQTLQAITGVLRAGSGVITSYGTFADQLAQASSTSWADRMAKAEAASTADEKNKVLDAQIEERQRTLTLLNKQLIALKHSRDMLDSNDPNNRTKIRELAAEITFKEGEIEEINRQIGYLQSKKESESGSTKGKGIGLDDGPGGLGAGDSSKGHGDGKGDGDGDGGGNGKGGGLGDL